MPHQSRPVKTSSKSGPRPWAYVNGYKVLLDHSRVVVERVTAAPLTPAQLADLDRFCVSRGYPRPREALR